MAVRGGDYFRYPQLIVFLALPILLGLVAMMTFVPNLVPYAYLGPLGTLTLYMVNHTPKLVSGIFYMTWVVHAFEAYYGYTVAKGKGLSEATSRRWAKWIFLYGIFSMKYLLNYEPKEKST